jgi:endonuclease/exonuclease/phosphatase family metal-dependent hydrolase
VRLGTGAAGRTGVAAVNGRSASLLAVVVGGVLVTLGFSSGGWAGGVPPKPPAPRAGLISFNVCGGVCRHGEVATTARFIAAVATKRDVRVVLLQELCYSQFRRVRELLARRGFSGRFAAQTTSPACAHDDPRHGTAFGVAVLVRGRISRGFVHHLPTSPGVEHRVLLGVTATIAGRTTFVAGVHLSPSPRDGLRKQLRAVEHLVGPRARGPAIVGGDFNTLPADPALRPMFARFTELAAPPSRNPETGEMPTYAAKKIDYVFVSRRQFTHPRASTLVTTLSDHRVYVGSAVVTLVTPGAGSTPGAG